MIQPKEPTSTLLFIPDISGFTKFVNETDISHSRHIIEELLEIIIDSNEIGLEVAEIEGDAIFFFRQGAAPDFGQILSQVERMYVAFHAHLKRYESQRICQCGACSTAHKLSLKFIAHFGEVATNNVKNFKKLFGREVILVHRLLKNQVPLNEYLLTTNELSQIVEGAEDEELLWAEPIAQNVQYDVGDVDYSYLTLAPLATRIPTPAVEDYTLPGLTAKLMEHEISINAPLELVFDVVADVSFRHKWIHGLKDSAELNGKITQNGSTHRCIIKGDDSDPFFVSHDFRRSGNEITFTDTNRREQFNNVFQLRKEGSAKTRLVMSAFTRPNPLKALIFRLFLKKKISQNLEESLQSLKQYCERLVRDGVHHGERIVLFPEDAAPASGYMDSENLYMCSYC